MFSLLAHCLHDIGLLFDIKKEHDRSLPHYEEALKIKNALAGFDSKGYESILANESDKLVLKCLDDDTELPIVTKATLPTAMTHLRMASLYAKVWFSCLGLLLLPFYLTSVCCRLHALFIAEKDVWSFTLSLLPRIKNSTIGARQRSLHYIGTVE